MLSYKIEIKYKYNLDYIVELFNYKIFDKKR